MTSTDSASYTAVAKTLHWLIAAAIIFMIILGYCFDYIPRGETRFYFIQLHKSIGISILLLSFVRLAWRLTHHAPPLPASMPVWEQRAAHVGHVFLYVMMIGVPLSGWAMVSASPMHIPTILFGLMLWPAMPGAGQLNNFINLDDLHAVAAYTLGALAVGHAAAALKHHFVSRDDVLLRMVPACFSSCLLRARQK